VDPELAVAVPLIPNFPFTELDLARRTLAELIASFPVDLRGVRVEDRLVPGPSGAPALPIRIFIPEAPAEAVRRPGVLDIHGGGFAVGTVALDDASNVTIAREIGAVVLSVEYRLAPEHPFPAPAEDCYAALVWFAEHAAELGVDPARIAVLGDSAGGGLAATTALLARDRGGPRLAMQVLIEPELDDRLDTHSMRTGADTVGWNNEQAVQSWRYYLGTEPATAYAAPARMADLSGLPPTFLTVNELDCLRDEGIEYARRLLIAGVSTELHCWPGTFHGFATLVPTAGLAIRAAAMLHDALRRGLGVRLVDDADLVTQPI
jgi:acetyl esterase/lipase